MTESKTIHFYGRSVFSLLMAFLILGISIMEYFTLPKGTISYLILIAFGLQIIFFISSSIFFFLLKVHVQYDSYSKTFTKQNSSLIWKSKIYLRSSEIEKIFISRKSSYVKTIDGISSLGWGGVHLLNIIKAQLDIDPIKVRRDPRKARIEY